MYRFICAVLNAIWWWWREFDVDIYLYICIFVCDKVKWEICSKAIMSVIQIGKKKKQKERKKEI